jgi:hypothetical protein
VLPAPRLIALLAGRETTAAPSQVLLVTAALSPDSRRSANLGPAAVQSGVVSVVCQRMLAVVGDRASEIVNWIRDRGGGLATA